VNLNIQKAQSTADMLGAVTEFPWKEMQRPFSLFKPHSPISLLYLFTLGG